MLRASGHEHLNGSIVVPLYDTKNNITQLYGRKICNRLRKGTPDHLYLEQPMSMRGQVLIKKKSQNYQR
ncbi:MAG: hypothetical protein U5M23_04340 [Marinagarivorans sp.]|nr:hypothetical protein [Marinagarivorans sp.]